MNARRAGQGCSTDAPPRILATSATTATSTPVAKLGDLPALRAALEYARADVEAYEQTEAYWQGTWSEP